MSDVKTPEVKQDDRVVNAYSITVAVLVGLSWGVSFLSRSAWSSAIAIEDTLTKLGITALEAGGIATAFYVGYVVSNFFSGWVIDALGSRITLTITTVGTAIATVLIAVANNYWTVFALRVLAGVLSGPLFSCMVKFNIGYFPDRVRAVVQGCMGTGNAIFTTIASVWFTPLVAAKGYKITFLYAGIITLVIGVLFFFIVKDKGVTKSIKNMESLTEEEKKNATMGAIKVFTQKDFLIGSVTHLFNMCATTGMTTWMLKYLINAKGMDAKTAGLVFGSSTILGLITGPIVGAVSDIVKTRKWLMVGFAPVTFALFMVFKKVDSVAVLTILFIIIKFAQTFVGNSSNIMQIERARGPYSGKVQGWYNAVAQLGSVIMPVFLGAILTNTGHYGKVIDGIASVYLIVMVLGLLVKDTYVKTEKK